MSIQEAIKTIVYAHGGEGETCEETLDEIESLVRKYVLHLTRVISETAECKGSMDDEAVKFALRMDLVKFKMISDMSTNNKELEDLSTDGTMASVFSANT